LQARPFSCKPEDRLDRRFLFYFATRPFEKAAFGAKIAPPILRGPHETAAFSGSCKPEERPARFFCRPEVRFCPFYSADARL
jgi:hypothetical protein